MPRPREEKAGDRLPYGRVFDERTVVLRDGRLIGVDNGDSFSHESYKAAGRHAFHGLCLAVVQATGRPGSIRITAASPNLRGATVLVRTT